MRRIGATRERSSSGTVAVHRLRGKAQLDVHAAEVREKLPREVTLDPPGRPKTVEAVLEDLAGLGEVPLSKGKEPERIGTRRNQFGIVEFVRRDAGRGQRRLGIVEPAQPGERLPDAERVARALTSIGAVADDGSCCLKGLQRLREPMLTEEALPTDEERTRLLRRRGNRIEERRHGLLQPIRENPQRREGRAHAIVFDHADVAGRETAPAQLHLRHPS